MAVKWIKNILSRINMYSLEEQYVAIMSDMQARKFNEILLDKTTVKDIVNGFIELAPSNIKFECFLRNNNYTIMSKLIDNVEDVCASDFKWDEKPLYDLTEKQLTELINDAYLCFRDDYGVYHSLEIHNGKAEVIPQNMNDNINDNAYMYVTKEIAKGCLTDNDIRKTIDNWKNNVKTKYGMFPKEDLAVEWRNEKNDFTLMTIPYEKNGIKYKTLGFKILSDEKDFRFFIELGYTNGSTETFNVELYRRDKEYIKSLYSTYRREQRTSDKEKQKSTNEEVNNEVYLKGYFYLPTNKNGLEEALKVLEKIGFNMDNADEIELRDSEGNVLETMFNKEDITLDER